MGRHETFEIESLRVSLVEIKTKYGEISVQTIKKAHLNEPFRFPSYKTFQRRMGNIDKIRGLLE